MSLQIVIAAERLHTLVALEGFFTLMHALVVLVMVSGGKFFVAELAHVQVDYEDINSNHGSIRAIEAIFRLRRSRTACMLLHMPVEAESVFEGGGSFGAVHPTAPKSSDQLHAGM